MFAGERGVEAPPGAALPTVRIHLPNVPFDASVNAQQCAELLTSMKVSQPRIAGLDITIANKPSIFFPFSSNVLGV